MLFCCLWRNVEASCRKHFVVVSSPAVNKLRRLRATSVIKSPWSVAAECIALVALAVTCRSNRSQHAMEPYIASELRFLPEFDVLVRGSPSKYRHDVWRGETRMVWLPDSENNLFFFHFDRIHKRDRRTSHDDIGCAGIASRGKKHSMSELVTFSSQSGMKVRC